MFVQEKGEVLNSKGFFVLLSSLGSRRISDKSRSGFYDGSGLNSGELHGGRNIPHLISSSIVSPCQKPGLFVKKKVWVCDVFHL